MTIPFPEVKIGDPVLAAISNVKLLQSFTVYSCGSSSRVGTRTISLLLQTCLPLPKLTELCIDLQVSWQDRPKSIGNLEDYGFEFTDDEDEDVADNTGVPSLETIIEKAEIAQFSQTPTPGKIKSLQLPVASERSDNPLALPLLKSGLLDLESCTIFSFSEDSEPNDIEQVVRKYCPNLKHLRCAKYNSFGDGQRACAFTRGCSGIQSFAAEGYCEEIYSYDRRIPNKSLDIISTLVSHHCDTLEDFELDRCTGTFMSDLREVLTRSKLLKRYYVTGYYLEARGTYRPGVARSDLKDPSGAD
ncbi:hypothetical protein BGZ67_008064 [Mortierella alpina]|nr:hypothetical protein BGZ67_008064 [Mortierella alpina]